jgi:hypothetical protein
MLVLLYTNSIYIPPIMIINKIYESSKSSVVVACILLGRAKDLSTPLYKILPLKRLFIIRRPVTIHHARILDKEALVLGPCHKFGHKERC